MDRARRIVVAVAVVAAFGAALFFVRSQPDLGGDLRAAVPDPQGLKEAIEGDLATREELGKIERLSDLALMGNYNAYQALALDPWGEPAIRDRARKASRDVEARYADASRVSSTPLRSRREDGSVAGEDELTPLELRQILSRGRNQGLRARAARKLGDHADPGAAEALVRAMSTDASLWVRVEALRSYERLTGFERSHVFAFTEAASWHTAHRTVLAERWLANVDVAAPPP